MLYSVVFAIIFGLIKKGYNAHDRERVCVVCVIYTHIGRIFELSKSKKNITLSSAFVSANDIKPPSHTKIHHIIHAARIYLCVHKVKPFLSFIIVIIVESVTHTRIQFILCIEKVNIYLRLRLYVRKRGTCQYLFNRTAATNENKNQQQQMKEERICGYFRTRQWWWWCGKIA